MPPITATTSNQALKPKNASDKIVKKVEIKLRDSSAQKLNQDLET